MFVRVKLEFGKQYQALQIQFSLKENISIRVHAQSFPSPTHRVTYHNALLRQSVSMLCAAVTKYLGLGTFIKKSGLFSSTCEELASAHL